ncbi:hypothetical protein BASA81_006803 [Batrachochytrium salamandrivorans]|nr:hypothetical protein BASA81_006803 [Batrachochytrium salamandrivorans]
MSSTPLIDELGSGSGGQGKFDAVRFLNDRFPDEASLLLVHTYRANLSGELSNLKSKLETAVLKQSHLAQQAVDDVLKTKSGVSELHVKVKSIRQKAEDSERKVKDVCHDITKLDRAKTNLSNTMVALSKISKFITALDQLDGFTSTRRYLEASLVLDIVNKLYDEFANNTNAKMQQMLAEVNRIRNALTKSVFEDIQAGLGAVTEMEDQGGQFYSTASSTPDTLRGACLIADLLSPTTKKNVRKTLLNVYLQPYDKLFAHRVDDFATDRRFAWMSRVLNANAKLFDFIFPESWDMQATLALSLCQHTAEQFKTLLGNQATVQVGPMVKSMKKVLQFEHDLIERYGQVIDEHAVKGIISHVFDPYLPVVVNIFLQNVRETMDNALVEELADTLSGKQNYRVYPSSSALFQSIKFTMMSMLEYTNGIDFLKLCLGYKEVLTKYSQALEHRSGISPTGVVNSAIVPPSLLDKPLTVDLAKNLCIAINTFEYMADEIPALEKQCKRKLDPKFTHQIEFETERDLFFDSAIRAVNTLATRLVKRLNVTEMEQTLWSQFRDLGDSSPYVTRIIGLIRDMIPAIHMTIAPPMMFRSFCDSFASLFLRQLQQSVWRLKRVNEEGSRQLFVDLCALERMLLDVPPTPNHAYTKFVENGMRRHKMLFKILSVQQTKMNVTIEDFARSLGPSASVKLFHDMLDLRGVPKGAERKPYVKQAELAGIPATNGAEDKLADEIRTAMEAAAVPPPPPPAQAAAASLLGTSRLFNFPSGQGVVPPMMSTKSLQESLFGSSSGSGSFATKRGPTTPARTASPELSHTKQVGNGKV